MLTDEQIKVYESVILQVLDAHSAVITEAAFKELMESYRTLQQQNKQMRETLEVLAECNSSFANFVDLQNNARKLLLSLQDKPL